MKTLDAERIARPAPKNRQEHSVPWFWPLAAGIELGEEGFRLYQDNLRHLAEAVEITFPPPPEWATVNRILLDLDTMRVRDFSRSEVRSTDIPVLVDAPYAGHSATIADYAKGQSLVETLQAGGLKRVLVTDWKSATPEMKDFNIDKYLADIDKAVAELGDGVHLIGLCQGGWMSAMYTARFPGKVRSLVLAGAPIDTDAGNGSIKEVAHALPMLFFEELVPDTKIAELERHREGRFNLDDREMLSQARDLASSHGYTVLQALQEWHRAKGSTRMTNNKRSQLNAFSLESATFLFLSISLKILSERFVMRFAWDSIAVRG